MYNEQMTSFTVPVRDALGSFSTFSHGYTRTKNGTRIGPNLDSRQGHYFDIVKWRQEGRCGGPLVGILGDKGNGKSTLNKVISSEYACVYNNKRKQRVYADDHRHSMGKPEYSELAHYYHSEPVAFTEKINIFDQKVGFTIAEHQETAEQLFVAANNDELPVRYQQFVIETAVYKMFSDDRLEKSIESLGRILLNLNQSDGLVYLHAKVLSGSAVENINWQVFMEDAGYVAQRVVHFLSGAFGENFGGTASIADRLKSRAVIVDFYQKNEQTMAFLLSFLHRIKMSAELRGDLDFMFEIENHDENYIMWNYRQYSTTEVKHNKQSRTTRNNRLTLYTTHSLIDLESTKYSGDAFTNVRGIDVWYFFGMKKAIDREATADFFKLPRTVTERLANLQRGQFAFMIGNEPIEFGEIVLTPMRERLSYTEESNDTAAERR